MEKMEKTMAYLAPTGKGGGQKKIDFETTTWKERTLAGKMTMEKTHVDFCVRKAQHV